MRITYLFGNGLDLSFGLKTSYFDFYKFLEEKSKNDDELNDNLIYKQLIKDIEDHKLDLWADYELRLGNLTPHISIENVQKFNEDKILLDLYLREHLINEEKKLNL
ncbi:MAG: bacteriophage abortive infection AbiH family protein, partial [Erysipelotrichaceae bacterium]|nr:bacteriophage abortive infection AbiH family protein [Erysipelotrichaceae bacterium]